MNYKKVMIPSLVLIGMLFQINCTGGGPRPGADCPSDSDTCSMPPVPEYTADYDEQQDVFNIDVTDVLYTDCSSSIEYSLLDRGDTIQKNDDGHFSSVTPSDYGYDLLVQVHWKKESRFSMPVPVSLVKPIPPLPDPISAKDLQNLINLKDSKLATGQDSVLAQDCTVKLVGSQKQVTTVPEVIQLIKFREWQSVIVKDVKYDDANRIVSVTLSPVGEVQYDDEEEDY